MTAVELALKLLALPNEQLNLEVVAAGQEIEDVQLDPQRYWRPARINLVIPQEWLDD